MKVKRTIKMKVQRFKVGDRIRFKMYDGEKVEVIAVRQIGDNMLFIHTDCLEKEYPMYDEYNGDGYGDFDDSDLLKHLNSDILSRYPCKIINKMVAFDNGYMVRLPTEKEIFGVNKYGDEEGTDVEQFECMKQRRNRIAFHGYKTDKWKWYWLGNKKCNSSIKRLKILNDRKLNNKKYNSVINFVCVGDLGYSHYNNASENGGVRPVFMLKN